MSNHTIKCIKNWRQDLQKDKVYKVRKYRPEFKGVELMEFPEGTYFSTKFFTKITLS